MKRAHGLFIVVAAAILLVWTVAAQAAVIVPVNVKVTDFSDWVSDPWGTGTPVTLTPTPKKSIVTIAADGSTGYTWGGLYDDNTTGTAIGMKATINISQLSATTGNVGIGFSNSLGMIGNHRIQVNIAYEANNYNQYRIVWRIKSKDVSVPNATWIVLGAGTLSDLWVSGYNIGNDMTIYFKRVGNGITFGINGTPYTVTWKSTKSMTPINYYPELFGSANSGANTITGVIKNVYMLY